MSNESQLTPPAPSVNIIRGSRQSQLLTEPVIFEDDSLPTFVRIAILIVTLLLFLFLLWASLVKIDEVASAPGQVVPSASVKVVQHLEGGSVAAIEVVEGELVQAGKVLVRMDPVQPKSELDQMQARNISLLMRHERLMAFIEQREPDFNRISADFPALIEEQRKIWAGQVATNKSAIEVIDSQIDQRRREVKQLNDALDIAVRQHKVISDQVAIRSKGVKEGVVSRQVYLETRRAQITAEGELGRLKEQIQVATDALVEVEKRQRNIGFTQQQDALTEVGSVSGEIEQVRNALSKLQDRVDRLEIKAPVAGLVQDLKVRTVGEVIPAGGVLTWIVPVDEELEAEVRISPSDIGHIKHGQPVKVKISTYEYTRYGSLPGTLARISASTFMDEQMRPYYKGVIRLARPYLGPAAGQNPVLPGMAVDSDIITGEKRLIEYLLKPIYASFQGAFRER